jgi:hypothetical protein
MRSSTAFRVRRRAGARVGLVAAGRAVGRSRCPLALLLTLTLTLGLVVFGSLVGAVSASAAPGQTPAPPTLEALLAGFRTMPGFEARFEEKKTLALLAVPLTSRGRLFFAPPGTLLRRVETPNPHDILIREHVVRISTPRDPASQPEGSHGASEAHVVETIDLAHRDDVRPLVESMLWIFSGDFAQLQSIYALDYRVLAPEASGGWQLRLVPRAAPLSRLIRELVISGRGLGADRLEILETTGDRTATRIFEANPDRRFAAGEIEKLFGLERP